MSAGTRGVVCGVTGLFTGAFASQLVDWPTLPRALLVAGVAVGVAGLMWLALRRQDSSTTPLALTYDERGLTLNSCRER